MAVEHVEVLVEEPSMEAALRLLLCKMLGGTSFEVYARQCKEELLKRLPERLCGYAGWLPDGWRIVVIVDQDNDDCARLKAKLESIAERAGLVTRTRAGGSAYRVVNRLAIEELEAWCFGDWVAVQTAYPKVQPGIPRKARFRDADAITGGTCEAFERILQRAGYFRGGLRKIEAARNIAVHMDPDRNISKSFQVLRAALGEMAEA